MKFSFVLKIGLAISLLSVGVTSASVYALYSKTHQIILNQMAERLKDIGRNGASSFTPEDRLKIKRLADKINQNSRSLTPETLQNLKDGETLASLPPELSQQYMASQDFQDVVSVLSRIKQRSRQRITPLRFLRQVPEDPNNSPLITSAYLLVPVPEAEDKRVLIFLADADHETSDQLNSHDIGTLYATSRLELQAAFRGSTQAGRSFYRSLGRTSLTAAVPIEDEEGNIIAVLGIDYDSSTEAYQVRRLQYICFSIVGGSLGLSLVVAFLLAKWLGNPIEKLQAGAENVRRGNFDTFVKIKSNDELELLADAFNSMIVEIGKYAKTLQEQNAELLQLDQLKDEFLTSSSYEFKAPVLGMMGLLECMLEGVAGDLTPLQEQNLILMLQSSRHLSSLVDDILDFVNLKHETLELQIKPVSLSQIVGIVLAISHPLIGQRKLQFINHVPTDLPFLSADEKRLQQIFHNLLQGAIRLTDSGQIEISAQDLGSQVEIEIQVQGNDLFFTNFEQAGALFEAGNIACSLSDRRTNFGLAVAKKLIELHGGTLTLKTDDSHLSRFCIRLPICQTPSSQNTVFVETIYSPPGAVSMDSPFIGTASAGLQSLAVNHGAKNSLSPPSKAENFKDQLKILVVDDEVMNQQVLTNYLSLEKYQVYQASDGLEALSMIQKGLKPDLILLDIMMPKMSGYEVCQELRKEYLVTELPIILLTDEHHLSELMEVFNLGVNDYLTKPFLRKELLLRVKTHLQLSQMNVAAGYFVPRKFISLLGHDSIVNVKLGDQVQKEMTILFSDIRNFTSLSETMSPKDNFNFINAYLKRVSPAIRNRNGFIDKYIGDGVMALFPESAEDALLAAIDMQRQVADYNQHRIQNGRISIAIGIGIHTGSLMLGTIGDDHRMEGTVISDAVNLTSRLEDLTKVYGSQIIISEKTLLGLEDPTQYNYRFLDKVQIKGRKDLAPIFEVFDGDAPEYFDYKAKTKSQFELGIHLYYRRQFSEALNVFNQVLAVNPQDRASQLYQQRCLRLQDVDLTKEGRNGLKMMDDSVVFLSAGHWTLHRTGEV